MVLLKRINVETAPCNSYGIFLNSDNSASKWQANTTLNNQSYSIYDSETASVDRWYHVLCTFDESILKLYVDGELKSTATIYGEITYSTLPLYFGTSAVYYNFTKGKIDDIRIYNRAINECEINALYTGNIPEPATITSHPHDVTICNNNYTNFYINYSGEVSEFQWQVSTNNGVSFININDNYNYNNSNTANLSIANIESSMNNYIYRCIIIDNCNNHIISNSAILNISDNSIELFIPQFFTPNSDGVNDTWEITGIAEFPDATIKVFNRFGKLMTSYSSFDMGWNAYYNGNPMPSDSYWYIIDLNYNNRIYYGYVTIKR